jgi:hypothetical protein
MNREYTTDIRRWHAVVAVLFLAPAVIAFIQDGRILWNLLFLGILLSGHVIITRGMPLLVVADGLLTANSRWFSRSPSCVVLLDDILHVKHTWSGSRLTLTDGRKIFVDTTGLHRADEAEIRERLSRQAEINARQQSPSPYSSPAAGSESGEA